MDNSIINSLEKNIEFDNKNKSSHWNFFLNKNSNYRNPYESLGFGVFTKKNLFKSFFHFCLARIVFGNKIFKSETYKYFYEIFDKNDRQIDNDSIRHIFTFDLLKKMKTPSKVCVIGDGKCNFVIGSLLTFPNATIFSINLSETLINDYLILKEMKIIDDRQIQVIENENDKIKKDKKLILIPSNLKNFLFKKKISMFFNIVSFQEMTNNEINKYFKIIKSNKSLFYCCNRKFKKLVGGERLYFEKYPWGKASKIFFEDCPWHQKFYQSKYPFIRKYDGKVQHCLVDYSN